MVTVLHIDVIVSDPEVRRGRPVVAGTGIRVQDIAAHHLFDKQTPEGLAAAFGLDVWKIHAALAYYYMHKAEIDADIRQDIARADQLYESLHAQGKATRIE